MKGKRNNRLFDTDTFKKKAREESVIVALRKEIATTVKESEGSTAEIAKLDFVLSTPDVDRHKDTINQDGWILDPYKKNPVVLWAHDQSQRPVAKAPAVVIEKATRSLLVARGVEFTPRDLSEEGWATGQMYLKGFLNAVSVGFLPHTYQFNEERGGWAVDFLTQELLEFSCVPVPANAEALMGAKSAGIPINWVVGWAEKILDTHRSYEDRDLPQLAYVDELRRSVAPATFAVPARKDEDEDDEAEDKLIETMAGVEAALLSLAEAVKANTEEQVRTRDALASMRTSEPAKAAAPRAPLNLDAIAKAAVAKAFTEITGRKA